MLVADLGRAQAVKGSRIRPEYANRPYRFGIEASQDGRRWRVVAPVAERQGSPIEVPHATTARYLRVVAPGGDAAMWEWSINPRE